MSRAVSGTSSTWEFEGEGLTSQILVCGLEDVGWYGAWVGWEFLSWRILDDGVMSWSSLSSLWFQIYLEMVQWVYHNGNICTYGIDGIVVPSLWYIKMEKDYEFGVLVSGLEDL